MKKLVILLVGIIFALQSYVQAKSCNVIIHASKSLKTTKDEVRKYKHFDNVTILKNNGWYLVSVASLDKSLSEGILEEWKEQEMIPEDSFCSAKKYARVNGKAKQAVAPVAKVKHKPSSVAKGKVCNVIIHASKSLQTTKKEVLKYKHFEDVSILKNNGWYLVSVAKLNKQQSNDVLKKWKTQGQIPQDSFCSAARYRTVNFKSSNKAVPKAIETAEKINKKMAPAAKPVVPKAKQVKPQKATPKNIKNSTQPLSPDHALVLDFNKNIKQYQKNKLNLINFYNKANNSLAVTLQSPTQDNLLQHKKLVKSLLFAEKALVESYKVVVSKYQANADRFTKIKGVEQIPDFLKNERNNIDIISKKILEMNQRLCQSKSINCK
ncbi:hypothetical protein [Phocoenobacter skyensis]|uniref:SPOR domain-containing protein n=1 Tax=Phocoenobacter skyensis TaxID=97481 RepID=A0A1H7UH37_9PAST|nr:hypothetical protein [Pasteurella skyensis]MDP8080027.1 hypothetical protein [Pasteurella skyensis]MDP8086017.1 hypothetical protein [Pasteurella skyensis]MDP8184565.1 hypothetical protein [Pasteurella skyensis]QLB23616.1 hypothetical protein A6B44_10580 [Pasteurella skyensis]SEL96054.1 hypothetical protein SAMN05444853_10261 [Pasteurella skyensis]